MKLPLGHAEVPAAHMNLISNKTTETSITVNWTGGGLINECNYASTVIQIHDQDKLTCGPQRILNGIF